MDRNTIIGFVLIFLLMIGMFMFNERDARKLKEEQQKHQKELADDSIAHHLTAPVVDTLAPTKTTDESIKASDTTAINKLATSNTQQPSGPFVQDSNSTNQTFTLENEDIKVIVAAKGGEIVGTTLKKYKTFDGKPLVLINGNDNKKSYSFVANGANISTAGLIFSTSKPFNTGDKSISLRLNAGDGKYFEQTYSLSDKGYIVNYKVSLVNLDDIIPRNSTYLGLDWNRRVPKLEKEKTYENKYTSLSYKDKGDEVGNLPEGKDGDKSASTALQWIAYKQQFFNTTLISLDKDGFKSAKLSSKMDNDSLYLKEYRASVILPYEHEKTATYNMQYYLGPNHYQTLKKLDIDLDKIISLGFFAVVNKWVIIPTFNFLEKYITNYGIIILLLTLFIKIILTPLTYRSQLSMAKMKVLKPELDELKEKYKDDQQKFGTEQMKLYGKAGVNPLSGCIPTLLIIPVLAAMYSFFPSSIELRQEGFLWAHDLSTYDSIYDFPGHFILPFYGDHISLFTLLMTASSVIYALANSQLSGAQEGPMKYTPYIFPIMLMGIFNSSPAALTYFYFLNNLISYAQQFLIQKFLIDEKALHKQIQENKKKPAKTGGFGANLRKRLEEAQKQQEALKKAPKKQ